MNFYPIDKYLLNLDNVALIEKKEHSIVVVFSAPMGDKLLNREFRGASAEALWLRLSDGEVSPLPVSDGASA